MVTGTRDPDKKIEKLVCYAMTWIANSPLSDSNTLLLQGGAKGVDEVATDSWHLYQLEDKKFKALWKEHGKAAGGKRNQQMVDFNPDICVAFPGPDSIGTWDAVRRAQKAEVLTFILTDEDSMYRLYYYTILDPGTTLEEAKANSSHNDGATS